MKYVPKKTCSNNVSGSLCWYCENAVPNPRTHKGCSWSRDFKPVDGWEAISVTIPTYGKIHDCESFCVISCPEFLQEPMWYPSLVGSRQEIASERNDWKDYYGRLSWDDEED